MSTQFVFENNVGVVAQLGEHLPCTQGVRSSILLGSTNQGREIYDYSDQIKWAISGRVI